MAFLRHKETGFRCAVSYPKADGWSAMFLRPGTAASISESGLLSESSTASAYGGAFADLAQAQYQDFALYPEAVLQLPDESNGAKNFLFITRGESLTYRVGTGVVQKQPLAMLQFLPADFQSGVDVLLQAPGATGPQWRTYVFKGNRVLTYNPDVPWQPIERNVLITEGPGPDQPGWAALPADFRSDLDHVVALAPASGGVPRSLIVKGTQGLILNWQTGVEKSGSLTSLLTGLDALPAAFKRQYLPLSGTYRGTSADKIIEVRLDVDRPGTLSMISGDIFSVSGGTTTYANSFRSTSADVRWTDTYVVVTGEGLAWDTPAPELIKTNFLIYLTEVGQSRRPAPWLTLNDANYYHHLWQQLLWQTAAFRTVDYELDMVTGQTELAGYDTADATTPPGYVNRVITVPSAFSEAGIDLRTTGTRNVLDTTESGTDLLWSDAELHTAMVAHFSGYRDVPQWKLWALVAGKYAGGSGAIGIMFDYLAGLQRQGMAVFAQSIQDAGLAGRAWDMHTYVHELGHAFNLVHSWDKASVNPPAPLGPRNGYGDLSWMNYPQNYQGPTANGTDAYWSSFPFRFTDNELRHLRHGFYRHVIMGGSNWATNAASDLAAGEIFAQPLTDESGLVLELQGQSVFEYGEPVVAQLKLGSGNGDEVTVASDLSPTAGHVTVSVIDPYGRARLFRPLSRTCGGHGADETTVKLTAAMPAVYASAYLGYGADGLYFSEPGLYKVTAVYRGPDGSRVVSATRALRVRQPIASGDRAVGEYLMGDDQGQLLAFHGSDAPQLQHGNDALQEAIERYPDHPLTAHALLARGANAGRHFQHIRDGRVVVRDPNIKESVQQLGAAIKASTGEVGLDNITLNAAMRRLARVHAKDGNLVEADAVLEKMVATFRDKGLPKPVLATISAQAAETRATIHGSKAKAKAKPKRK
ncbi:reprolysin-like metallopeptidase [Streptomyces boninensis]|uniref:reprolysin-like metallopeptidase n=1 Tax=Streptomyces boninensis TaxID=2039455 RepID=UPI003B225359